MWHVVLCACHHSTHLNSSDTWLTNEGLALWGEVGNGAEGGRLLGSLVKDGHSKLLDRFYSSTKVYDKVRRCPF